jgi:chromosome segregation ATPase
MNLVEKLLGNLMRISELYQKEKGKAEELNLRDKRVHYLTEPLKSEISRLTKDNNNLHNNLITLKEDLDTANDRWRATIRSLEDQKSDLEYMLKTKTTMLQRVQDENGLLRTKCNDILIKLCYPTNILEQGINEEAFRKVIGKFLNSDG